MIPTLEWLPEGVNFLDQTKLPLEETYFLAPETPMAMAPRVIMSRMTVATCL